MLPYYILIGVPTLFYFLLGIARFAPPKKTRITVDCFFFIMLVLLIFRAESVGVDVVQYKSHFINYSTMSFTKIIDGIFAGKFETGYVVLCRLIGIISDNFRYILAACALISVVPVWMMYRHEKQYGCFLIVMFAIVAPFAMYFSGLRQAIAMSFAIPAYKFCRDEKPIRFLMTVVSAFLFHRSAIVLLLMYPAFRFKLKSVTQLLWAVPPIVLIFIYRTPIFLVLMELAGDKYYSRYAASLKPTGAISVFLLLAALSAISFILPDSEQLDEDDVGLRNILLLSTTLQIFAGIHSIAMRLNYYFLPFVPIAVARCLAKSRKNRKPAFIALISLTLFATAYFFYFAYTDRDIMQIYPYISMFAD